MSLTEFNERSIDLLLVVNAAFFIQLCNTDVYLVVILRIFHVPVTVGAFRTCISISGCL